MIERYQKATPTPLNLIKLNFMILILLQTSRMSKVNYNILLETFLKKLELPFDEIKESVLYEHFKIQLESTTTDCLSLRGGSR